MTLKRKMMAKLERWNSEGANKAFMLIGARQTGKTFIVRAFAKRHFKSLVEVNFLEDSEDCAALAAAPTAQDFITRLALVTGQEVRPGESLIFLDEIQEAPDLLTIIKFLVEDGTYKVVVSGSMLGTSLKGFRSFPVGYVQVERMFPLDFEEFCWAQRVPTEIIEAIRGAFRAKTPLDDGLHERLMRLLRYYIAVGGMPEVVARFTDNRNDALLARRTALQIVEQYKFDISRYANDRAPLIRLVYAAVPSQLDKQNKRFRLDTLKKKALYARYEDDFAWLIDAGVVLPAYAVSEPKRPLARTKQANRFKLYDSDTGLLISQYEERVMLDVVVNESALNFGAVYENAVAQELACHATPLYYYYSSKKGEVDFLVGRSDGSVLPIEVKSGKDYKLHTSLNTLLGTEEYGIDEACVLCMGNVREERRKGKQVYYLPLYMAFCIAEESAGTLAELHLPQIDFGAT